MDGKVVIDVELNSKDFDRQIDQLTDYLEGLEEEYEVLSREEPFDGQAKELRKLSSEIVSTKKKITSLNNEKEKMNRAGMDAFLNSLGGIGNSINKLMKKVVKWGLAVFGVRSAYLAVRAAASTLSQYNEQIGTDLEYIRFALASALQPVVEYLIKLVYKLLGLINAISVKLFGFSLFGNATAEAFNKSAKSAEKLKKSIAGFDELNVVSDTSSDAGGGIKTPSVDLSKTNEEASAYVNTMKKAVDQVTSFWEKDWEDYFNNASGNWGSFIQGILLMLEGFYLTFKGIFEVIGGIIDIFVGIFTGDLEKMNQGWNKLLNGFVNILKGVISIIVGVVLTIAGAIKGIILDLINGIVSLVKSVVSTIKNIAVSIATTVGNVIASVFKAVVNGVLGAIEKILNSPIRAVNGLIKVINKYVPGINLGTLKTFNLPRLAKGGIISQPGRGVALGSAIGGERGQEGVIPLTDSQQMALLGEAIGKYVRIDNMIENYIDGRKLNRILQSSNDRTRFAMNG